jgi:transketolase
VISDAQSPRAIVIATGSEVSIALAAQKTLADAGVPVRVVSMPCTSVFDRQDRAWRDSVLPKGVPRVAIEAGVTDYWRKYVGLEGEVVGIDRFGESAPAPDVYKFLGIDAEHVVAAVQRIV